ncbi:hypothetical protein [Brachybacterium sp. YJGR34]|uniref:hypothetical protein n=1 Tax=Brachybacterium sp. YJGR34 TaxID=2059911 RepID=UPI000E0B2ECC|nr:hypothetical protein [Brachybacterium sp. YJGR34]
MRQKIFVVALVLITAAYCWGLGWIAWGFVRADSALGYGLAFGIVILLALTVWVTWREVLFGLAAGRLAAQYSPPGSAIQDDPRAEFEAARTALQETDQERWQDWFRLALAYDALRDRRAARMATRRAIDARRR